MIFKITEQGNAALEFDSKQVLFMSLNRNELLEVFDYVYNNPKSLDFSVAFQLLDDLRNPVEKEITKQILSKLQEFDENSEIIKRELDDKFPGLQ